MKFGTTHTRKTDRRRLCAEPLESRCVLSAQSVAAAMNTAVASGNSADFLALGADANDESLLFIQADMDLPDGTSLGTIFDHSLFSGGTVTVVESMNYTYTRPYTQDNPFFDSYEFAQEAQLGAPDRNDRCKRRHYAGGQRRTSGLPQFIYATSGPEYPVRSGYDVRSGSSDLAVAGGA